MITTAVKTEQWASHSGFILAAIGFAVGLGNIWRFPYMTGAHGGSAFLFIYLTCVIVIALPLLITELAIGRRGRSDPSGSIRVVAAQSGANLVWRHVGTLAVFCVFIILSYYTVLAGWTVDYLVRSAVGSFEDIGRDDANTMFSGLMNNPLRLLLWHTIISLLIIVIVRRGVQAGVEKAAKMLMPALFLALVIMVMYGAVAGNMAAAVKFLLEPDFSKVTSKTILAAIGQAFFSIGIGEAVLITFGAYLPNSVSIPRSAIIIVIADTGVALLAGFAIFPLVFAHGLEPSSGAGLIFQTLPIAFGQMPYGSFFASVFFILLMVAALSSCIGLGEAVVSWVDEKWRIKREKGIIIAITTTWIVGFASIMSLGEWSGYYPFSFIPALAEKNIFDALDFIAANILLLLGALLTSIFFGWLVPKQLKLDETGISDGPLFLFWDLMLRFLIPVILCISLISGISE